MRTLWRIIAGFFKWTWRLLNFVREFILNVFLILIILAGVGIWYAVQDKPVETTQGALLVDLSGSVVDKPSVNNKVRQSTRRMVRQRPVMSTTPVN